jgi:hypothetical protein
VEQPKTLLILVRQEVEVLEVIAQHLVQVVVGHPLKVKIVVTAQGYTITVGAGGAGGVKTTSTLPGNGANTSALGITSTGGGGAGRNVTDGSLRNGTVQMVVLVEGEEILLQIM